MSAIQVLSIIAKAGSAVYGQFSGREKANKLYKVLVPTLHEKLNQGLTLSDPQVVLLIEAISNLPGSPARKYHFKRRYLEDRFSMLRLPNNPERINRALWW